MAWLLTQVDPSTIFAWCILTGDIGRPVMSLAGFSGLIATVRTLWTLPAFAASDIVTIRNKGRRYRSRTVVLGWFAALLFIISIVLYTYCAARLATIGKVCEMARAPHSAVVVILPFLLTTFAALFCFIWLQIRAIHLKQL